MGCFINLKNFKNCMLPQATIKSEALNPKFETNPNNK